MTRLSSARRAAIALVGLASLLLLAGSGAAQAEPGDFVVQQVCVDAADHAVAGDPAHCADRRKLRVGEIIPYGRVDAGNWQALYSYPVRGPGGEWRAMAEKVFGGNDKTGSYGDLGVRSGYDLIEIGHDYVSGIRTSDPGGGDQIFWRTADCVRQDGWLLFPPNLQPGAFGQARSTLKITPGPSIACPALRNIAPDFTTWDRPTTPILYTSGKRLDTIVSQHFAYGDPADPSHDDDSMERFYFTREYGFSRWEAWQTQQGCEKRVARQGGDPAQMCAPSSAVACNGPSTASFYGKTYIRLDCRDSTFYVVDAEPFDPLVNAAAPGDIDGRNLLANATFADGTSAWSGGGTITHEPRTSNAVLDMAGSPEVWQEVAMPAAADGTLHWGIAIVAHGGGPVPVTLALRLEGSDGWSQTVERTLQAADGRQAFAFAMPWPGRHGDGVRVRFSIRAGPEAGIAIDDAVLALMRPEANDK